MFWGTLPCYMTLPWYDESTIYVSDVVEDGVLNEQLLRDILPKELAEQILECIQLSQNQERMDRP